MNTTSRAAPTGRVPAAYVRKSKKLAESAANQLVAIKAIAARDGVNGELVVYADVGVSGRYGKRGKSVWARLLTDIEADRISAVYISVLDRAGRDLEEWFGFARRCREHHVPMIDQTGGDRTSEANEDVATFEMWAAQKEGKKAVERAARALATSTARGDTFGHPRYGYMQAREPGTGRLVHVPNPAEPLAQVVAAAKAAGGNMLLTAKALNAAKVRTRSGRPWDPRTLGRIIDVEAPALRGRRGKVRRRAPSTAPLSRLVECHCGQLMTPARDRRSGAWLELYCSDGHNLGAKAHGRIAARARHVLDYLRDEAPKVSRIHIEKAQPDVAAERQKITDRRDRFALLYGEGDLTLPAWRREQDRAKDGLADLVDADDSWTGLGPRTPLIDWDATDEVLGEQLRRLVRVIHLGPDGMPASVEWRRRA